jgi:hypothetical protein
MHKVSATTVVNINIDDAWEKLSDLSKAHFYVPDLTDTKITTEQNTGVGTSRIVYSQRPPLTETVLEWNEGSGFVLRLHHQDKNGDDAEGVPPMFSRAKFSYSISAESDTSTRLTNSMEFDMKWGAIGSVLAKLITKPMQQMQEQIIVGQRLYYETGLKAEKADVIALIKKSKG